MILLIAAGILGLVVGSFLNVVIHRLPIIIFAEDQGKKAKFNLAIPSSHCPMCKHPIKPIHNIPIISFLCLRGKCAYCKEKISWQYPIIEFISCIVAIFAAFFFGNSLQTYATWILSWGLIALVAIDFKHMILPDIITIPLLWLGLLLSLTGIFTTPDSAIVGAAGGYTFLWVVAAVFKALRKIDGMGHGDFKLLALFGAWLGWHSLPFIIFAASLMGALVGLTLILFKKRSWQKPLPFGPYIAFMGWISIFWGPDIWHWYLKLMG